ncbi:MAG TPA: hypothetical protein PLO59_11485, partial [Bacteroidia bacterium]|nr:hypothetical protein [Bacteroidia bacterium]
MLAGAVVGSNIENASIYYNPGTLGFADSIKVTVSSGLYEFTAQRFTNGVNSGQNLIATDVKRFPLSIFPTFKLKNNTTLGFIYVPRLYSNTIVNDVQQNRVDVLQNNKPVPFYTSFDISNYESEWWYGVSFSKKLDKRSGIGITGFVSYRNQNFRYQYAADAWVDTINNTYMNTLMQRQIKYYCYKTIFKIGYFNKHDKYAWGCAATIPAFAVYSNGKTSTRFWFNNFIEADSTSEQTFIAEQQINLKADFKYPITISAGGQLVKGKCTYYLTAESFFEIAPYDVLEINNRIIEINGVTINANKIAGAQTASKFITNVAVAMQYRYKPKQTIAIGLATDFN